VAVEALVDCGPFQYHLLVQFNDAEDDFPENALLQNVDDALDEEVDIHPFSFCNFIG